MKSLGLKIKVKLPLVIQSLAILSLSATGLTGYLRTRGLQRLFLAGLATDFCVYYSAEDARREGFEVVLVEDACRAIDLEGSLATAMQAMRDAGVEIVTAEAVR